MPKNKWFWVLLIPAAIGAACSYVFCLGFTPIILSSRELFNPPILELPIVHPVISGQALNIESVSQIADTKFGNTWLAAIGEKYVFIYDIDDNQLIIDISQPTNPRFLSQYKPPNDRMILDAEVHGKLAFLGTENGFEILNISLPKIVETVGTYQTPDRIKYVSINDNRAYLIDIDDGFYILDITAPNLPTLLAYHEKLLGIKHISDIVANGNYVYLVGENVYIIDMSVPLNPIKVGSYTPQYGFEHSAEPMISVASKYAFLNEGYKKSLDPIIVSRLTVMDISNPAEPSYVASYNWCEYCFVGGVSADLVLLQMGNEVHLVNFSKPNAPIEVAYYGLPKRDKYGWFSYFGSNNYLYLVDDESGFYSLHYSP